MWKRAVLVCILGAIGGDLWDSGPPEAAKELTLYKPEQGKLPASFSATSVADSRVQLTARSQGLRVGEWGAGGRARP